MTGAPDGAGVAPGPMISMAMEAPPRSRLALADERAEFTPVPVFVGPRPGWVGPVLAARDAGPETASPVSAFASDKEASPSEVSAKAALSRSVRPVAHLSRLAGDARSAGAYRRRRPSASRQKTTEPLESVSALTGV